MALALATLGAVVLLRSDARAPKAVERWELSGRLELPPVTIDLPDGESLTYAVGWSSGEEGTFLRAGQGVIELKRLPGDLVQLQMSARSNKFFDLVYRLRDEGRSLVEARGGHSVLFEFDKDERREKSSERVVFDYCSLVARSVERKRDGRVVRSRVSLDGPVLDALSCVYYVRAAGPARGKVFRLPVFQAGKLWELTMKLGEPEEIELPGLGRFRAYRARPEARFPGLFERKGELVVWLEERTGVLLRALVRIPVGSVELRLVGAENSPLLAAGRRPSGSQ